MSLVRLRRPEQNRPETATCLDADGLSDPPEGDRLRTGVQARKIALSESELEHFDDAYWTACDEAHAKASYRFPTWWTRSGRTIA